MKIAERSFARLAYSALSSTEKHSAPVALPFERRWAEDRHLHNYQSLGAAPGPARLQLDR
jgi:hypothetical protein